LKRSTLPLSFSGLRPVGAGALVAHLGVGQHALDAVGPPVPTVVAEQPLDADPLVGDPAQRPSEEAGRGGALLVGQRLGVGQPGAVVDRHVQGVVAHAGLAEAAGRTAQDVMTAPIGDAPELLDIDVEQLAGPCALVAHDLPGGTVQLPQPRHPVAAQDGMHPRACLPELPGDTVRAQPAALPARQDRLLPRWRQPPGTALGSRGPVSQPSRAFGSPPAQPLVRGRHRHALCLGSNRDRPPLLGDPGDQQPPSQHRQLRPTMHRESLLLWFLDSSERGGSHLLNNLSGNYT
jgi:hypothetical protein